MNACMRHRWPSAAVLAALLVAAPVAAQQSRPPDPDAEANVHFGPLSLRPGIVVRNIGVDTNVFNQADQENPQSDFTMTFSPVTEGWLRMGRTWLSGAAGVDWVYYDKFESERSTNTAFRLGLDHTFNRLSLRGTGQYLNTRERSGFEIDARIRRVEEQVDGEVALRFLAKTTFGVTGFRRRTNYDDEAVYQDVNVATELDRTTSGAGLVLRHTLTPLTTLALNVSREDERFVDSTLRDSDSTRVTGTVTFQPLALINGSAAVGLRWFDTVESNVPSFQGLVTAVNLSYSIRGATRLGVQMNRDVQYSFEPTQPYYLENSVTFTVQQQVYGPFDVMGRIGGSSLNYADSASADVAVSNRTDRVSWFGGGAGYRLGTNRRLGFNIDHQHRRSSADGRTYSGLRFGFSFTYDI